MTFFVSWCTDKCSVYRTLNRALDTKEYNNIELGILFYLTTQHLKFQTTIYEVELHTFVPFCVFTNILSSSQY